MIKVKWHWYEDLTSVNTHWVF